MFPNEMKTNRFITVSETTRKLTVTFAQDTVILIIRKAV